MSSGIELSVANALSESVGRAHGLSSADLQSALDAVAPHIVRVERERAAGGHRYRDLPNDKKMLRSVLAAVKRRRPGIENLVVLGIGGSALGNIALQSALNAPYYNLLPQAKRRGPRLYVLDNVDPTQFVALLDVIGGNLKKTLFNVVSKSGETAETAAQFLIIRDLLTTKLGPKGLSRQTLVTTDAHSGALREFCDREQLDTLAVPDGVGGRFSVLSAVGLFSAAMCGINPGKLLAGAGAMSRQVEQTAPRKNPAALLAAMLHAFYERGKRIHVLFSYSYQLKDLADWYRQLWAESLSKSVDLQGVSVAVGPTPIAALGATDQHSQVQLYREGPNDKVFIFLEVGKFDRDVKIPRAKGAPEAMRYLEGASLGKLLNAEKRATEYALVASQRPCLTLRFPRINETTVGQFIMLWEAATTLAGGLLNINPYDQPAVQLGKDFTYALMGKPGYGEQAKLYREFATRARAAAPE